MSKQLTVGYMIFVKSGDKWIPVNGIHGDQRNFFFTYTKDSAEFWKLKFELQESDYSYKIAKVTLHD